MTLNVCDMTIKINNILKVSLICLALSACGGNKKPEAVVEAVNADDITRPPSVVKNRKPAESESNPEETISYEEWKRKRDAEIAEYENAKP